MMRQKKTSRVSYTDPPPPHGGHVCRPIATIFKLILDVNKTNVFTKFHDDCAKYVTSRVFTTNVLTTFHENWTTNVTSRVFTYFHNIHLEKTAPPPGGHVFPSIWTIFELFHDDWFRYSLMRKTAPPTGGHVF
ncbi:hypothetical protein DPMN_044593 [Dreissena polymorpha]|uniref:Uncharacterized protein n=1 Tax=Dreissena polymorpha TaxID=45954 RepID=A0A9D4D4X0_DREPO|nr:hypothetical protein DPMN_044593 [Dreissena polymorpha]